MEWPLGRWSTQVGKFSHGHGRRVRAHARRRRWHHNLTGRIWHLISCRRDHERCRITNWNHREVCGTCEYGRIEGQWVGRKTVHVRDGQYSGTSAAWIRTATSTAHCIFRTDSTNITSTTTTTKNRLPATSTGNTVDTSPTTAVGTTAPTSEWRKPRFKCG